MITSTTPDFQMDFFVQFEEWFFAQAENHTPECLCSMCDPEAALDIYNGV